MRIPIEVVLLILLVAGTTLMIGLLWVDHRIIKHICQRDQIPYPVFWPWSWHWQFRIFRRSWYKEAREAGYYNELVGLQILWVALIVVLFVLWIGGFVESPRTLVRAT